MLDISNSKPSSDAVAKFKGRNIINIEDLSYDDLMTILQTATFYHRAVEDDRPLNDMEGKIMMSMFFEPSTRTRCSFESAMYRLGGRIITIAESSNQQNSSAAKGETLHDSIMTVNYYGHVIVCRTPEKNGRHQIAGAVTLPYINAGDGDGEHPTQALLDIYTVYKRMGTLDGLTYAICGDLKYGRAAHSLLTALSKFSPKKVILASPSELCIPKKYVSGATNAGIEIEECTELEYAIQNADVVYMTRVQRERFPEGEEGEEAYARNRDIFIIDERHISMFRERAILLHPLPRVNEVAKIVDDWKGAAYFEQVGNGVPIRMALLALLTGCVR
ncbi:MAG: aspartate carbamoyltransferase [Pseudomonadales bacterium]|jgi:aspartate carbamoyltransferase catalytic subunit|nr:aspartate carbamoyltransferase [Pseudomonadales bacterium]